MKLKIKGKMENCEKWRNQKNEAEKRSKRTERKIDKTRIPYVH